MPGVSRVAAAERSLLRGLQVLPWSHAHLLNSLYMSNDECHQPPQQDMEKYLETGVHPEVERARLAQQVLAAPRLPACLPACLPGGRRVACGGGGLG